MADFADSNYADTNYYQDPSSGSAPTGPVAVAQLSRGSDGKLKTNYVDAQTGKPVNDLNGYTVFDGENYYDPSKVVAPDKDGKIDPDKATQAIQSIKAQGTGSTRTDALGTTPGPKATASNNFGYKEKPGFLGPAALAASAVNPGVGAAVGMLGKAYNVSNMEAVNDARVGLGLSPTSLGQRAKQAMSDNKGQIANVNIGDNKYSVGFGALSPTGKTNLTYNEAKTRAAILGKQITETPKDEVTTAPKVEKQGLVSKITGMQKGWLTKALNDLTGIGKITPETAASLPDQVKAIPTPRPEEMAQTQPTPSPISASATTETSPTSGTISNRTAPSVSATTQANTGTGFSQAASAGLPDRSTAIGPSQANPLGVGMGSVGFAGMPNNPGVAAGVTPDKLGRVGLTSVNFDKMGLQPAMAAQMKSFQQKAIDAGIANKLSVDVSNMTRTPEQQTGIKAAGYSKTKNSYHLANLGLAVDVSPTAVDDKGRITDAKTLAASRQIAKDLGLKTLDPSFDPAHIQAQVPGQTARSLNQRQVDPTTGMVKLSPEEDLGVRVNSVPTPTARPNPAATKTYDSQVGLAQTPEDQDQNAFGKMKQDMNSLTPSTPSVPDTSVSSVGKLPDTPAGLAAMGFTNRTPAEKAKISQTIAGELGQKSLANLTSKDPAKRAAALAEVGTMAATIENRAATTQFAGVNKTLAPSQYNANMPGNLATTKANMAANPSVSKAVGSFYSGGIPGTKYGATNYHATAMTNPPTWGGQMTSAAQIGQHTFGTLPGYSPDANTQSAQKAFGTMAGTQFSAGKKTDDTVSNPGFSGLGTPSGMKNTGLSTGLGVHDPSKSAPPGYGGAGLGYSGATSGTAGLGNPGGTSGAGGASGSQGSSAGGKGPGGGSGGSNGGGGSSGGSSNSRDSASSPAGGYGSSASKGSTGGL